MCCSVCADCSAVKAGWISCTIARTMRTKSGAWLIWRTVQMGRGRFCRLARWVWRGGGGGGRVGGLVAFVFRAEARDVAFLFRVVDFREQSVVVSILQPLRKVEDAFALLAFAIGCQICDNKILRMLGAGIPRTVAVAHHFAGAALVGVAAALRDGAAHARGAALHGVHWHFQAGTHDEVFYLLGAVAARVDGGGADADFLTVAVGQRQGEVGLP